MTTETWKPIPGYEGLYDVSSFGRVRGWSFCGKLRATPFVRKQSLSPRGYPIVTLYRGTTGKHCLVSRLVLMAFVGCPDPHLKLEASHIDGNPANCNLDNLAWETRQQNEDRKTVQGNRPRGEKHARHKLTDTQVREIRKLRDDGISPTNIAMRYGVTVSNIVFICHMRGWKHVV